MRVKRASFTDFEKVIISYPANELEYLDYLQEALGLIRRAEVYRKSLYTGWVVKLLIRTLRRF